MLVKLSGVEVEEAATTYERLTGKLMLENIKPSSVIFSDGFRVSRWRQAIKRAADIVFSLVGVVLSAVPMALTRHRGVARIGGTGHLSAGAGRTARPALHAVQIPLDADSTLKTEPDLGAGGGRRA